MSTSTYAICAVISGRRYYWCKVNRRWGAWHYATVYSAYQRKREKLPKDAFWVSVLHGMGEDNSYPALSELSNG